MASVVEETSYTRTRLLDKQQLNLDEIEVFSMEWDGKSKWSNCSSYNKKETLLTQLVVECGCSLMQSPEE